MIAFMEMPSNGIAQQCRGWLRLGGAALATCFVGLLCLGNQGVGQSESDSGFANAPLAIELQKVLGVLGDAATRSS